MKRFSAIIIAIIIIFIILAFILVLTSTPGGQPEPTTKIAATIFPIYDIARNVAGDKAEVVLITPPGASPHTFEITAEQIRKLQDTDIMLAIGHGLDDWITEARNAVPGSQVKTVSQGVHLREFEEDYEHEEEHSHEGIDPHYWLSIDNAIKITQTIRDALSEIDPDNSSHYYNNATNYVGELESTKQIIENQFINLGAREIITMHNAWGYFAEEFDLKIVATFEPFPGQEPTLKYLAELSNTAKQYNVKTIFSEPQLSNQVLIPFLKDLDMDLAVLDPVGGLENRNSYINTMLYNAQTIKEKLK